MSRLLRVIDGQAESLGSFVLGHREAGFRPREVEGGFTADNDEDSLPLTAEQERARLEEAAFAVGHDGHPLGHHPDHLRGRSR